MLDRWRAKAQAKKKARAILDLWQDKDQLPIPNEFPKRTTFWDAEEIPFVRFPNGKWFNAYGGFLKPRVGMGMEGSRVSEAEWRTLVEDSISSLNRHRESQ